MTKLPADLPENWTQGQTVSPNGTEVGLTEQHGYNYLMKQVNATQKEVNGIQDALPDVAQQTTVEEINQKIGTEGDADTQPTVFGRLAQVKNALGEKLQEKLQEVLTKVTGIDEKIGKTDDTVGNNKVGSVMGKLNTIYNLLIGGLVVYDEPGTYEWTVPAGITKIKVSGAGAGAGAGGACVSKTMVYMSKTNGGGGGSSGASISEREYEVTPGTKLTIVVGKHGIGGKGKIAESLSLGIKAEDGTDGEATVIGELITLPGGRKGTGGMSSTEADTGSQGTGGTSVGEGSTNGNNGFYTHYRDNWYNSGSNGNGGKSLVTPYGDGGSCTKPSLSKDDRTNYAKLAVNGKDGKDGYVMISWGV